METLLVGMEPLTLKSCVPFIALGTVSTVSGGNASRPMVSIFGHDPGTMNCEMALNANWGDPPVNIGAAAATFFCKNLYSPFCSPFWAIMDPTTGISTSSSPPSLENCDWATGRTPRKTSVKVWARRTASSKLLTGKSYWQGWITSLFA